MIYSYPGSLHNHTHYSNLRLRDCIIKENELMSYAEELGHKVVAFTDHESISGWVKIEKEAKKHPNLKVLRGNEIYLVRNGLNASNYNSEVDRYYHFILIAKDLVGARQIMELSTRAWMRSYMARGMRRVPTYYQDLFDIIALNPGHVIGSTACFKAGTQVETIQGWKNIEDIQKGDFVINRYGEWEEVLEPTSMYTHQYGYNIEITGNERPIICTDNHEFLVISNNSKVPRWVQAKDLNLTPRSNSKHIGLEPVISLYTQNPIIKRKEWDNSYLKETKFSHRCIQLPDEIVITPELMRLFGLFLGDGCISLKQNPRISFSFNDKEFNVYMESFILEASRQLNISWSITERPENHKIDISSSSADLINLFYYLFGDVKANTKFIPTRLHISKELDYELVFGYLLADGYFRIRRNNGKVAGYISGEFVSASISKQLSYDLYDTLNRLNITSSIMLSKGKTDKNDVTHQDSWYVTGSNQFLGSINKLNNYSHQDVTHIFEQAIESKKKDFISIEGVTYRKIRFKKATKIELNETVYCLNNMTHSFKCENLIVHNCLGGALPTQILRGTDRDKLDKWINQMISIFGKDDFYLEMQPSHNQDQIKVNRELFKFANYHGLNYIITTDSHYLKKEDRVVHKAYLNAQNGDREVDDFYASTYMMSTEELESYMKESFDDMSNVRAAYSSIQEIADKCEDFTLEKPLKIPDLIWKEPKIKAAPYEYFDRIPYLKTFMESDYVGDHRLCDAIVEGIESHPDLQNQRAYDEINSNLEMTWISSQVNKAHWSAYYLNLQQIIDLCWEAGSIVGPGRGSGVGFILLYVLGITQINPLRETTRCFAWRFLNPERVSVLDVDFDIEGGRRNQVLNKFREFYGQDRVANVATFRTEKSKSAILTAARGLGIDVDVAQYIASLVPADRGQLRSLDQCMNGDEENGWAPVKQFVYEMTTNYPELWEVAHKIEGLICGSGLTI